MKVFVGAENQQDALNLLEELYENGDIDKFIENSIQEVVLKNKTDLKNVDFLNSYIKDPEDDEITIVYDYIGFLGMNVYSVDIEENKWTMN